MPATPDVLAFDLDEWKGRNALLIVFAPSTKSPAYEQQIDVLQGAEAEFHAHDLVLVQVLLDGESHVNDRRMDDASAVRLRERFDVAQDAFCVVVVGLDGSERRRTDTPLKPEAIFDLLDGKVPSR